MSKQSEERFEKELDRLIANMEIALKPDSIYAYQSGVVAGLYMAKYALASSKVAVIK